MNAKIPVAVVVKPSPFQSVVVVHKPDGRVLLHITEYK